MHVKRSEGAVQARGAVGAPLQPGAKARLVTTIVSADGQVCTGKPTTVVVQGSMRDTRGVAVLVEDLKTGVRHLASQADLEVLQ